MSRKPSPHFRYGLPAGARSAKERRAEAWVREHSFSGRAVRVPESREQNGHAPQGIEAQPAAKLGRTTFVNLQREGFRVDYYDDEDFLPIRPHLNIHPRIKIIADSLGRGAIRRFGFEEARTKLEKAAATARAVISFTADRVTTHSTGQYTFVGLAAEEGTRKLLEEDLAIASQELELPKVPEVRSLLVARFDNQDPNIDTAVQLFNHYIGLDPAAEHVLLAGPIVRSHP